MDKLKEAVEHIKEQIKSGDYGFSQADEESLQALIDLAERYLAVECKMPEHEKLDEEGCLLEEKYAI